MKKSRKRNILLLGLILGLILVLGLGLLSSCTHKGNPLPEGMDEETVLAEGRKVVTLLVNGDYQAVVDQLRPDVAADVTAEQVEAAMEDAKKAGAYVSESDSMATGRTVKDSHDECAEAVIMAKHEKDVVRYRIAFDTEMNLIGLQVRKV